MTTRNRRRQIHELDVTVWVGKAGVEPVAEELADQLENREFVKTKFLRSARGGTSTDELAGELAELADVQLIETRGNTAVYER